MAACCCGRCMSDWFTRVSVCRSKHWLAGSRHGPCVSLDQCSREAHRKPGTHTVGCPAQPACLLSHAFRQQHVWSAQRVGGRGRYGTTERGGGLAFSALPLVQQNSYPSAYRVRVWELRGALCGRVAEWGSSVTIVETAQHVGFGTVCL